MNAENSRLLLSIAAMATTKHDQQSLHFPRLKKAIPWLVSCLTAHITKEERNYKNLEKREIIATTNY